MRSWWPQETTHQNIADKKKLLSIKMMVCMKVDFDKYQGWHTKAKQDMFQQKTNANWFSYW